MTMRVSQRLDYALQVLTRLAAEPAGSFIAAGELADQLQLPRRFVEQQVTALSRANIVECRRGASGGCALSRSAHDISVEDVVLALHGEVLDVPRQPGAATAEMWECAASVLGKYLAGIPLSGLAERQAEMDAAARPMYYI